ncbi:hypothetical protein BKA56DRAFT_369366 [Ilyonectria sp. MPI-CAGE-AT-0026]|nr:hypothetical protein BKA56DRAFT_369366 [Ilyonectria sp. MPI-CAGE-AT-0026]
MFGRRRRPILGAAVVVGASRAAAKHEVRKQADMESQREMEMEREFEARRIREEEQELRTQRAVDEAMKKAAVENQAYQQSAAPAVLPPPQQFYNNQTPIPMQEAGYLTTAPGQPYTMAREAGPSIQPNQTMRAPSPQLPAYSTESPLLDVRPKSAHGMSSAGAAAGSNIRYCTQCGSACQLGDRFCCQCGAKQVHQGQRTE